MASTKSAKATKTKSTDEKAGIVTEISDKVEEVSATKGAIVDQSSEIGDTVAKVVDQSSEIADTPTPIPAKPSEPTANNYSVTPSDIPKHLNTQTSTESIMEAQVPASKITPMQQQPEQASQDNTSKKNPNFLEPAGVWPPPIYVNSATASEHERFYVEHRWYMQWSYYDDKAAHAKRWYQLLQLVIGIGSVTVPVLVGLTPTSVDARYWIQGFTVAISLIVAAAAAIENVKKYGDAWRNYRGAAEELAREKTLYDVGSGPYRQAQKPFLLFAERCEDVIAKQNGAFFALKEEGEADKDGDGKPDNPTTNYSDYSTSATPTVSEAAPVDDGAMG